MWKNKRNAPYWITVGTTHTGGWSNYVTTTVDIPEDVQDVFLDVCAHRLILRPQARVEGLDARDILKEILVEVKPPLAD